MNHFPLIIALLFFFGCITSAQTQHTEEKAKSLHYQAEYKNCITLINSNQDEIKQQRELHELFLLQADCYLKLVLPEKYFTSAKEYFRLQDQFSDRDSLLYLFHKAHYYHYRLEADSSVFLAEQSMRIYNKIHHQLSDSLKTKYLIVYANCMRNKRSSKANQWRKDKPFEVTRKYSIAALLSAEKHASRSQKHRLFRVLGTTYNDLVDFYKRKDSVVSDKKFNILFQTCLDYYFKALKIREETVENDQLFRSQVFSLIGLTYQYNEQYDIANSYYEKAIEATFVDNEILFTKAFFSAVSWKGWNWSEKYKSTGDINYLKKSVQTYENGVQQYLNYFDQNAHETKGVHDGYRFSMLHKLPNSLFYLYQETKEQKYIDKALYYADLDNYLTYRKRRKIKDSITVSSLQQLISSDESLVVYMSSMNPDKIMAIIINQKSVEFVSIKNLRLKITSTALNRLTGKQGIEIFKRQAHSIYKNIFEPLIPHLKSQKNLIIISPSNFAGLNFELLISEPSKNINKWKKLPYIFHEYSITYALSPTIFRDNYVSRKNNYQEISILQDHFSDKTNLLFAEKLSKELKQRYNTSLHKSIQKSAFMKIINQSNVFMTIGHGSGSLYTSENTISINDSTIITGQDFYDEKLNTSLFITSACKTNVAKTSFSEGLTGGFSKALMYGGVRSTLTTNWEIDDQSSYYILKRFFHYLEDGEKRSKGLWLAKKDYWNHFENDALFQPFYWSAFQLTGKTSPVQLTKNKKSNPLYWFFIVIPIALIYLMIRKRLKFTNIRK